MVGLVVQSLAAVLIYLIRSQESPFMRELMGSRGMATAFIIMGHSSSAALSLWLLATAIFLIASLASIILLIRGTLTHVKVGSVLLIILGLISGPTTFGLLLGAVLMFASGLAGIAWAYRHTSHL